ncbi:MAG: hypothetical protein HY049_07185 [Acidobacteria bacterium]|nr:hypothetical protein [Acidobacteriota bacterium]
MAGEPRLSVVIESPMERWEEIVREGVTPAARALRGDPSLAAFTWGRFNKPTWRIEISISGREAWLSSRAAPVVAAALSPLEGLVGRAPVFAHGGDEPDAGALGGAEGEALARAFDHHDSLACLDFMEAEFRGELRRSRREISLLLVDSLADAFELDLAERRAFYERGWRWAFSMGLFKPGDREILDQKFESLRPSLRELLSTDRGEEERWGDPGAARIAAAWRAGVAAAARAAVDGCAAGRIAQDPVNLAWLWAQAHSNRLGIVNTSEAILRYFMYRILPGEEGGA